MSDEPPEQPPANSDEPPNSVGEVPTGETRRQRGGSTWVGFLLTGVGFFAFVGSYFLLPVVEISCFDTCDVPYTYLTAWEMSMRALLGLSDPGFLVAGAFALFLSYVPLLAAVTIVGCSIGYLVHPHRTFVTWNYRAWLVGISVVVIALPFLSFFILHPYIGYVGMLFGYALFWGGNRLFLTANR